MTEGVGTNEKRKKKKKKAGVASLEQVDPNTIGWLTHHDSLYHARVGVWLTLEAIASALVATQTSGRVTQVLAGAGLLITLMYWRTGYTLASKHREYSRKFLPVAFRTAWNGPSYPERSPWRLVTGYTILVHWLPFTICVAWAVLFRQGPIEDPATASLEARIEVLEQALANCASRERGPLDGGVDGGR